MLLILKFYYTFVIIIGVFLNALALVPNSGYDISKAYPIAFKTSSSIKVLSNGFICDFNSETVKLHDCKLTQNIHSTEAEAIDISSGEYLTEKMTRNYLGVRQFHLGLIKTNIFIPFSSTVSHSFDSQIISIFKTDNHYHAAWIYQNLIYFSSQPTTLGTETIKIYSENKVGNNVDCKGLGVKFICVYTSYTLPPGITNYGYYHLFKETLEKEGTQGNLFMYGISNIYEMKIFKTTDPVPYKMLICSINYTLSISCLPMNVPITGNPSPLIPKAKEVLLGCTSIIYTFSIANFIDGYAVICSKEDTILLQEISLGLDPIRELLKITVPTWNIIMPHLVEFNQKRFGLFYGNDQGYGGVGYHMLMIPKCISPYKLTTSTNNSKDLDFIIALDTNYKYEGISIILRSSINEGQILLLSDRSTAQIHKQYDAQSALRYYSSNIGGVFTFYFQFINKEGFLSLEPSCSAEIEVNLCYSSCRICTGNIFGVEDHQCESCLNGYYNRYDKYNETPRKNNCYDDETVGTAIQNYFLKYDTSLEQYFYFKCHESCKACTVTENHCTICSADNPNKVYYWVYPLKETCATPDEKRNYYLEGDTLMPCYKSCQECHGPGDIDNHNCNGCITSGEIHYPVEGKIPTTNCYSRQEYPDHYVDSALVLKPCFINCQTCENFNYNNGYTEQHCLTCKPGSYPYKKNVAGNTIISCFNENDTEMPLDVYLDTKNREYKNCHSVCKSCHGAEYKDWLVTIPNCQTCKDNKYERDKKCVENCQVNIFYSIYSYKDLKGDLHCYNSCPKFTVAIAKDCTNCKDLGNYFKINSCVDSAQGHYISNTDFNVITPCYQGCEECVQGGTSLNNNCLSCKTNYCSFVDNSSNCSDGDPLFYVKIISITNECMFMNCYTSCKKCTDVYDSSLGDDHHCSECKNKYIQHPTALTSPNYPNSFNCVEDCSLTNSYWYILPGTNDYYCTNGQQCPEDLPYLIEFNKQCSTSCNDIIPSPNPPLELYQYNGKCNSDCPANSIGTKIDMRCHDLNDVDDLIQAIPQIITEDNKQNSNHMLFAYDKKFHLCKTNQANYDECKKEALKYDFSILDLDECFELLRKVSSLPSNAILYLATFDIETEYLSTQVEYIVYDSDGNLLQLQYCKNLKVSSNKPIMKNDILRRANIIFDEFGYNILNSSDPFYIDICLPITSDFETDVLIEDRFDHFYSNLSFCEANCDLLNFNLTEYRAQCSCDCNEDFQVKTKRQFGVEKGDKTGKDTELGFFQCYQNTFSLNIFKNNIGNYATLIIFLFQFSICVFVGLEGIKGFISFISKKISKGANPPNPPKNVNDILDEIKNKKADETIKEIKNVLSFNSNDKCIDPFSIYNSRQYRTVLKSTNIRPKTKIQNESINKYLRNQNYLDSNSDDFNEGYDDENDNDNNNNENNICSGEEGRLSMVNEDKQPSQQETKTEKLKEDKTEGQNEVKNTQELEKNLTKQEEKKFKREVDEKDLSLKPEKLVLKDEKQNQDEVGIDSIKAYISQSSKVKDKKKSNSFKRIPDDSISTRNEKENRRNILKDSTIFENKSNIKRKESDTDVVILEQKQEIFMQRIKKYRKMSFIAFYCYYLRKRHRALSILFEKDVYDIRTMKLSYFLLSLSIDILFGTVFSLNYLISFLYKEKGQLPLIYLFISGSISSLAGYCIIRFLIWLMEFKSLFKKIMGDKSLERETRNDKLKSRLHKLRLKFVVYFFFMFFISVGVWYSATTFCGTFVNSQPAWGIIIGVSFGVSFIFPFIYYFIAIILVYISIIHKSRCLYYCSKVFLKL